MINRKEALKLLKHYIREKDNLKKSLAVEAIIREIARIHDKNVELWGLTGLLHNIDYEYTKSDQQDRGILSARMLDGLLEEESVDAIKANNYLNTDQIPSTLLDKALITTVAAVDFMFCLKDKNKSKKINDLNLVFVLDQYKKPSEIKDSTKNRIKLCQDLELVVEEFLKMTLDVLKKNSDRLDL